MLFKLLPFLLLISCAHTNKKEEIEDLSSYVIIAQSSYLKGCIDGMNAIEKKKTYGVRFNQCKNMSKKHKEDIDQLLK